MTMLIGGANTISEAKELRKVRGDIIIEAASGRMVDPEYWASNEELEDEKSLVREYWEEGLEISRAFLTTATTRR